MIRNDERTDIMHKNKRIGYIEDSTLYMIGLDGYATAICTVASNEAASDAVRRHHFERLR